MTPRWEEIRARFPAVERQVYLNTAGGGPMSLDAVQAVKDYYDEFYEHGDTRWSEWLARVEHTRQRLARFLGAQAEEVAFLGNASQGLNYAAALLDGTGEVLCASGEFPSVTMPWLARSRRLRFAPSVAELQSSIGPDTAVVCVSLTQYQSGERVDLAALSSLCRERGARLVVDGTQTVGVQKVDVGATPVDALVFSGYKWANAGYGIAGLYVRRDVLAERGLPAGGWRSALEPYDLEEQEPVLTAEARGLELGHPPFAGVAALGGALDLIERVGIEAIESRVEELVERLHAALARNGWTVSSPSGSPITIVPADAPQETADRLREQNVLVSARGEGLRISVHHYNDADDLAAVVEALGRL